MTQLGDESKLKDGVSFIFMIRLTIEMEIILIQRKGKGLSKKAAKPMWLAWIGLEKLSLEARPAALLKTLCSANIGTDLSNKDYIGERGSGASKHNNLTRYTNKTIHKAPFSPRVGARRSG